MAMAMLPSMDSLSLANNFGNEYATYGEGNVELMGGVEFQDFLELANNFGKKPSDVSAVPEPKAMTLVLLGVLLTLASRRKRSRQP